MKIIHLDSFTTTMDGMSLDQLEAFSDFTAYKNTAPEKIVKRAKDADILITNKVVIDQDIIDQLPQLKYICVAATGYDVVDVAYAATKGIPVSNVSGYSTEGVVQHVFALILHAMVNVAYYDEEVMDGRWQRSDSFCFYDHPIQELSGMTIGIVGFGSIGRRVGAVAHAFGMKVLATSRNPERDRTSYAEIVPFEELCRKADIVTLHAALNADTAGMIDKYALANMKSTAILVNTGRGGLIVESDLAAALDNEVIKYACLDVVSNEPPQSDNPLLHCKNCIITPHIAWASEPSRKRLIAGIVENISAFLEGKPILNRVN